MVDSMQFDGTEAGAVQLTKWLTAQGVEFRGGLHPPAAPGDLAILIIETTDGQLLHIAKGSSLHFDGTTWSVA